MIQTANEIIIWPQTVTQRVEVTDAARWQKCLQRNKGQ